MKKGRTGVSRILAQMTVLPLILFGIAAMLIASFGVRASINHEVRQELQRLSESALASMDLLYPGDYGKYGKDDALLITKGDTILNANHEYLDQLKTATSVDYTLFYDNLRVTTTLFDDTDTRMTGTYANEKVIADVLDTGNSAFYTNVDVFGENYYAYYEPIKDDDGNCIGMLATAMPSRDVRKLIHDAVLPLLLLTVVFAILAAFWAVAYSKQFLKIIQKLRHSFEKTAQGQFNNTVPADLLARKDEIGDMSHSLVDMQNKLRNLVEQDALTGLCNRRFGQQKLQDLVQQTKGTSKKFSIALGDIDFFKKFNDNYGHDCGDDVLREVSALLKSKTKDYGYAIRWGGEEFLLVFTAGTYEEHKAIMEDIVLQFSSSILTYNGQELSVTMTFGLLDASEYDSVDDMIIAVDKLLYQGKESGRNQLVSSK